MWVRGGENRGKQGKRRVFQITGKSNGSGRVDIKTTQGNRETMGGGKKCDLWNNIWGDTAK